MRIVSLLPGATEVLVALGLADDLVGISHECDFPPEITHKPVMVRGTIDPEVTASSAIDATVQAAGADHQSLYHLEAALFQQAAPELVITQDLCHVCAITPSDLQHAVAALPQPPRLLTLNPTRLDDVLADVERIGQATGTVPASRRMAAELRRRLQAVQDTVRASPERPTVACLEWLDPVYVAGHWVPDMVATAGGRDVLGTPGAPSRPLAWGEVLAAAPDVLILMPCGFTISRTLREVDVLRQRPGWADLPAVRSGRVYIVEAASHFSRPGPRLIDGVTVLAALCHPTAFGAAVPAGAMALLNAGATGDSG